MVSSSIMQPKPHKMLYLLLMLLCLKVEVQAEKIPLGAIFDHSAEEIQTAFKYGMMTVYTHDRRHEFPVYVDFINTADAFKLSSLICKQFARGIYAMIGFMSTDSFQTFHSYSNTFRMPMVTPWFPSRDSLFQQQHQSDSQQEYSGRSTFDLKKNPALDLTIRHDNSTDDEDYNNNGHHYQSNPVMDFGQDFEDYGKSVNPSISKPPPIRHYDESKRYALYSDFPTKVKPEMHQAILDTIAHYKWKNVIYLYNNYEGLLRLQSIFQKLTYTNESLKVSLVKKVANAKEALTILRNIETTNRFTKKHIILDCPTPMAKDIIISHVRDIHMGRRTYHYLIPTLTFDDPWESTTVEFSAVNITGFSIVDKTRKFVSDFISRWSKLNTSRSEFPGAGRNFISSDAAFIYDGVSVLKETFNNILSRKPTALRRNSTHSSFSCGSGADFLDDVKQFEFGKLINSRLREVSMEGLSGNIQFHENGTRYNYTVNVMEMSLNSLPIKIGQWSDLHGFTIGTPKPTKVTKAKTPELLDVNLTKDVYVVTSILDEPYLMMKKTEKGEILYGNDRFEGFCKDLTDMIAKSMNISYRLELVKDNRYGAENASYPGGWDGMVGELITRSAQMAIAPLTITASRETVVDFSMPYTSDMSIAPLTITAERERVVDFTKPFLNLGISIMIYKPKKSQSGVFGFMSPLSSETWYCVILAYLGVSLVLFIVTRFNPTEWIVESHGVLHNQFSIRNALWFSFAALVQQGSDISPRSLAGRVVGSVWWFFTLILISSYTANFAAVRTVNRMILPIKSAKDLAEQSEVAYGTLNGGSTYEFFRRSELQVYKTMFEFMSGPNQINVNTYDDGIKLVREKKGKYALLIESPKNDYTNNRKPCDTMKVGPNLDSKGFGIGSPLGSPLKARINLEVLRMKENGILSKLENKWWYERSECDTSNKQETATGDDELSLGSLAGIFYILIIGLVLAMFVSFLEFCYNSKKEAAKSQEFYQF